MLIRIFHQFMFVQHGGWLEATMASLMATCICCFLHLLGCPISWHKIALGRQVRWIGLDINFFSCFWQIPKKRDKALLIIHRVYRQGNKLERADLERLEGLFGGSPIPCQP